MSHLSKQLSNQQGSPVILNFSSRIGREPSRILKCLIRHFDDTYTLHTYSHTYTHDIRTCRSLRLEIRPEEAMRIIALSRIRSALCEKSTYLYIIYVYVCIITELSRRCRCPAWWPSTRISCRLGCPGIPHSLGAPARAPPSPPTVAWSTAASRAAPYSPDWAPSPGYSRRYSRPAAAPAPAAAFAVSSCRIVGWTPPWCPAEACSARGWFRLAAGSCASRSVGWVRPPPDTSPPHPVDPVWGPAIYGQKASFAINVLTFYTMILNEKKLL